MQGVEGLRTARVAPPPARASVAGQFVVVERLSEEGVDVILLDLATLQPRLEMRGAASPVCVRSQGGMLLVGDARGRILLFDLARGELLRSLASATG